MSPQASGAFYKSLFDHTFDGIAYCQMLFDKQRNPVDFVYIKTNKNFERLTGLTNVEGKKVTETIPGIKESNPELFTVYSRVSLAGKSERLETYIAPLARWFLISVYCPKKKFFVAIFQNITEQKRIEKDFQDAKRAAQNVLEDLNSEKIKAENLAQDLKKFKLALDNSSEQVVITDAEGTVMYANAALEKITGYKPEEAVGKKSGVLWKAPMPLEYYQKFWHTIKDEKKAFVGEIKNRRKNGELYTSMLNVSPVLDDAGTILFFVGVERDITREKDADKAKSEFISLASHQMRTPLTAINWYAEMLLGGDAGKLNAKQRDYFKEIYTAGQHMNEIVKSFLHILRLETGTVVMNPIPLDLVDVIRVTMKESQLDTEKKRLHIVEHFQESLSPLKIDTELIHLILQNLISNAVKYTSENGEITVSLGSAAQGSIAAGKTADEDSLLVSVRDTGIGITPADHDKIFTKFYRTENAKKVDPNGNGLGLYMTKIMTDIVGGIIWFDSEEGAGTTFYLLLPIEGKKTVH